jgi:hypothetical protein
MAETIVTLSGDDANLYKCFQRILAQQVKTDAGWKTNSDSSKRSTNSAVEDAARLERESKRAADAMFREHKKLMDAKASESRRAGQTQEAIARQTAFAEVNAAIKAADSEIKAAERILAAKKKLAAEEAKVAEGPLASLQNTVGVAGAIGVAVAAATKSWSLYKTAQDAALGSLEGLDPANRKLAQVATSADDLNKMQARADAAAMATGVSRTQAREVLFNATSEGYTGSYEAILAANSVVDPNASAKVAGKLPAIFKGKIGPMEAVSLALKGANESNLDFEQMANTLAIAGEGGAVLGSSPEETTAIAAVMSARFKSGDVAADRMKGFGVKAGIDPRFANAGFIEAFQRLEALPDAERKDFLGESQELNTFYVAMKEDIDKIKDQLTKAITERKDFAAGRGELRTKLKNAESVESISTNKQLRISRIKKEIATEKNLAKSAANNEISASNAMAQVEDKGGSIVNRFSTNAASFGLNLLGERIDPKTKESLASGFGDMIHKPQPKTPTAMDWYLKQKGLTAEQFGQKSIETSFKADAGKGPENTVATNVGLIKSLEDERAKLKPKLTELLDKQQITEAEKVQIQSAEFQLTKTQDLASKLGNRSDTKADGIRLDVDKARSRLNTIRENATLSKKEAEELSTVQSKDNAFATRIEELRRADAEKLLRETEKTNMLLGTIKDNLQGATTPNTPNAMRAQAEQGKQQ